VGVGTAFTADHVGSILRIGTSTTARPTGLEGASPFAEEFRIIAVADTTHCTLDSTVATSRTGVKCVISDPVDLDISLFDAFVRCCEKQVAVPRDIKGKGDIIGAYDDALFAAKCADSRVSEPAVAGASYPRSYRLSESKKRAVIE
jgi:hypothetical protein